MEAHIFHHHPETSNKVAALEEVCKRHHLSTVHLSKAVLAAAAAAAVAAAALVVDLDHLLAVIHHLDLDKVNNSTNFHF